MRVLLVFAPFVSPTYVPLGIATLAGYLKRETPQARVELLDLNLLAWEGLLASTPKGSEALAFFRGGEGDFYDREQYARHQEALVEGEARFGKLLTGVKGYLERGEDCDYLDGLVAQIIAQKPDMVGFSLFGLGQLAFSLALSKKLKEALPQTRIIFGGAALGAVYEEDVVTGAPWLEGLVVGEGEESLAALMRGEPREHIPGLVYRVGEGVKRNRTNMRMPVDNLPFPDFTSLPMGGYLNPVPVIPALLTRGCKWRKCRFCAHNTTFGAYRARSAKEVVDELEHLHKTLGASHFYFADLYVDVPELSALTDELCARGLKINYHTLGRPVNSYTYEFLAKIRDGGCRWISWGVESLSKRLLEVVNKGTTPEVVLRVIADSKRAGIANLVMMIYGLPTSTDEDLAETLRMLESAPGTAFTASAFNLFERTPFAKNAAKYGLSPLKPQVEANLGGVPVRSRRLDFGEINAQGLPRPSRGPVEVGEWLRRKRWMDIDPFLETLACEHFLLYSSR